MRIRRAAASLRLEDDQAGFSQASLENDDDELRQIVGAMISLFSGNDTLSSVRGVTAAWSTQVVVDAVNQQGLNFSGPTQATTSLAEQTRAGPFLVADSSGRDNRENGIIAETQFGGGENFIPWPDGGQVHLAARASATNGAGYRVNGILYYVEERAMGSL